MSIRAYKLIVVLLLCIVFLLVWLCLKLYGQAVSARRVEQQCMIAQDIISHSPDESGLKGVAHQVEFLMGYYDEYSNLLVGSQFERIVRRDYQQTLTNAMAVFHSQTTNDLGNDPKVWIQKYGY
jgi:hypothetical protein